MYTAQAFIKLESMPQIPSEKRETFSDIAMSIFLKNPPADPRALRETRDKGPSKNARGTNNPMFDQLLEDLTGSREQVGVHLVVLLSALSWVRVLVCWLCGVSFSKYENRLNMAGALYNHVFTCRVYVSSFAGADQLTH